MMCRPRPQYSRSPLGWVTRWNAKKPSAHAPKPSVRNSDEVEGREYHQAITHVHSQLQKQISIDSLSSLVERLRHQIQTISARQMNKAIPQIFAPGKDKHGENDDHDAGS